MGSDIFRLWFGYRQTWFGYPKYGFALCIPCFLLTMSCKHMQVKVVVNAGGLNVEACRKACELPSPTSGKDAQKQNTPKICPHSPSPDPFPPFPSPPPIPHSCPSARPFPAPQPVPPLALNRSYHPLTAPSPAPKPFHPSQLLHFYSDYWIFTSK